MNKISSNSPVGGTPIVGYPQSRYLRPFYTLWRRYQCWRGKHRIVVLGKYVDYGYVYRTLGCLDCPVKRHILQGNYHGTK